MAIPSTALANIYEAGDDIEGTYTIMHAVQGAHRRMRAAIHHQKATLKETRDKLTEDMRVGHALPPATHRERLCRLAQITELIQWLEQTEEVLANATRILDCPPRSAPPPVEPDTTTAGSA